MAEISKGEPGFKLEQNPEQKRQRLIAAISSEDNETISRDMWPAADGSLGVLQDPEVFAAAKRVVLQAVNQASEMPYIYCIMIDRLMKNDPEVYEAVKTRIIKALQSGDKVINSLLDATNVSTILAVELAEEAGGFVSSWIEKNTSNARELAFSGLSPTSPFMIEVLSQHPELKHIAERSMLDSFKMSLGFVDATRVKDVQSLFVERGILTNEEVEKMASDFVSNIFEEWQQSGSPRKDFIRRAWRILQPFMKVMELTAKDFPEIAKLLEDNEQTLTQFWQGVTEWRAWVEPRAVRHAERLKRMVRSPYDREETDSKDYDTEALELSIGMQHNKELVEQWLKDHTSTSGGASEKFETMVHELFPNIEFKQLADWGSVACEMGYALDELAGKPGIKEYAS